MSDTFRDRIQREYDDLTPSFRRLGCYILQNQLDAAFMTTTDLASKLDMDAATVVRFSQKLGYSGYRELVDNIQRVMKEELVTKYSPALDTDDASLLSNLLENERHNLTLAQAEIDEQANQLLPLLVEARQIWVTGQGLTAHLAALCALSLRMVDLPAIVMPADLMGAADHLSGASEEDVLIGFSLSGLEVAVANALRYAGELGVTTLAFVAWRVSPAGRAADVCIVAPSRTRTDFPSFTGLAAMTSILISALNARYPERCGRLRENHLERYRRLLRIQLEAGEDLDLEMLPGRL
jgi:DNA-binding MurR/RpiR family transcriptional regulator